MLHSLTTNKVYLSIYLSIYALILHLVANLSAEMDSVTSKSLQVMSLIENVLLLGNVNLHIEFD